MYTQDEVDVCCARILKPQLHQKYIFVNLVDWQEREKAEIISFSFQLWKEYNFLLFSVDNKPQPSFTALVSPLCLT